MSPVPRARGVAASNPRGAELNRVCIAFTITAALFVAFRIVVRAQRKILGLDDLWICIALLSSVGLTVTVVVSVRYGYGMHLDTLTSDEVVNALFWWYLAQVFYKGVTWPTKISILLMYRRVFGAATEMRAYGIPFRRLVWGTTAIVAGCFISFETAGIFACTPIQRSWNHAVPGTCVSRSARFYAYVGCNFATDLMCLAIPVPLINGLNVSKRQKWSLMAVFFLGGFVSITTLVRVDKLYIGPDITYNGAPSVLWSCVEANVGIICACLPLMRPLFNWLVPWFARRSRTSGQTYSSRSRTYFNSQSHAPSGQVNLGDKGDTVLMSRIEARDRDAESTADSEIAITGGIHKKVEVETYVEPAETDCAVESDRYSRRSSEGKNSDVV